MYSRSAFVFSTLFLLNLVAITMEGQAPEVGAGVTLTPQEFGAAGNGSTDDTNAIQMAINQLPYGGTLSFGDSTKTYLISRSLMLKPNAAYAGGATIRMSSSAPVGTQIAVLSNGASNNVTVNGLNLDSNGVGGGLAIDVLGGSSTPAQYLSVTGVTFRNTLAAPRGDFDGALYNPVGQQYATISGNQFLNCGVGISITNADQTAITNNTFSSILAGDAISLTFYNPAFEYGQGIQITGNRGQNLMRMAIELWSPDTTTVTGAVIANNAFSNWNPAATAGFGISVMTGSQATISNNILSATVAGMGFGIELGAPSSVINQNTVTNFAVGIAMHNCEGSQVTGNMFVYQEQTGIEITNAAGSKRNLTIQGNSIWYAEQFGIWFNDVDWGGSTVSWNNIMRSGGQWGNDSSGTFMGIASTPPDAPVTVSHNLIFQTAQNTPPGFRFVGITLNGNSGENAGSAYDSNSVISSAASSSNTTGLYSGGAGSADGAVISNSLFQQLNSASGGGSSPGVQVTNNQVVNCLSLGPITLTL